MSPTSSITTFSPPSFAQTNLTPSGNTLSDGRPIYSSTRPNGTFNAIDVLQSVGEGSYNALTVTMSKRMRKGWQMQANYTYAKSTDNAPFPNYVLATGDDRISDPSNISRDKGVAPFNQTHTFALSSLLQPKVSGNGFGAKLANNNQLVIWDSAPGVNYQVLATTNLLVPFAPISDVIPGSGSSTYFYDPNPTPQKFYQVQQLP